MLLNLLLIMANFTIPYNYTPRPYQVPFLQAFDQGCKRFDLVWHRRSGKDKTCYNAVVKRMFQRVGGHYYMYPTLTQGRAALWEAIDNDGFRLIDHFPRGLLKGDPNNTEMKFTAKNGSYFRIIGAKEFDGKMGSNPVTLVNSEYSLHNPKAWNYFRPIFAANDGAVIFNYTPRGENHAYDLHELAMSSDDYFSQVLTVDDTNFLPGEILDRERREIIRLNGDDSIYRQEYYCDFSVPIAGSYYANHISQAYRDGRITSVPIDPRYPVHTAWDLGVNDTTAIWFFQEIGRWIYLIDFYESSGVGLDHYAGVLRDKGYVYGRHYAPHDIKVQEFGAGKTRIDTARNLGINFVVVTKLGLNDGIDVCRGVWSRIVMDKDRCRDGLNSLKNYHKKYDDARKTYLNTPYHDWSSNAADAFRSLAVGIDNANYAEPTDYKSKQAQKRASGKYAFAGRPDAC